MHKITVPVYLACQFTDEQTGGHCPDLASHFTGTAHKWFTFTNGVHTDSLDPATFNRWYDFLRLFVARQRPALSATVKAEAPVIYHTAQGVNGVTLPSDPIQAQPSYGAALGAFDRLPPVRILFDNGAGGATPGNPVPGFEQSFPRFPLPGTSARSWYLSAGGLLRDTKPTASSPDRFTWNKPARPATDFTGPTDGSAGGLWNATAALPLDPEPAGHRGLLPDRSAEVEHGDRRRRLRAAVDQVHDSGRRPPGHGHRGAARRQRDLRPERLAARERAQAVPAGARCSIRSRRSAGRTCGRCRRASSPRSRSRSTTRATPTAPARGSGSSSRRRTATSRSGRSRTRCPADRATVLIAHTSQMPSRLILPVVPGVRVPTALPPCPWLRGEPCRKYVPTASAG